MVKVTFIEADGTEHPVEADTSLCLMRNAVANDIPGIIADCGGELACATCHVYIDEKWLAATGAVSEEEREMLECAMEPRDNSRLSCQVDLTEALDGMIVRLPDAQL